jgi:hypothetical protein
MGVERKADFWEDCVIPRHTQEVAMSSNSEQMIPQVRKVFERLLAMVTGPEATTATLDQMERTVFRLILHLGYQLLLLFVIKRVEQESHAPIENKAGEVLHYHSQKRVNYFSIFGDLVFERAYFYERGKGGECPLDAVLSLPERKYSDMVMENAELLGVDGAYQKGLETLVRLLMLDLPKLALETGIAEHSQMVKKYYEQKARFPKDEEGPILVAQADGKGVPLVRQEVEKLKVRRKKGDKKTAKKEAIATAVYSIEAYPRTPEEVAKTLFKQGEPPAGRPSPCHKQIFATLKGKEKAIHQLAKRVTCRLGKHIRERVALTDGSEPLQKQMLAKLPGFVLILDIIHAVEYLWKAGTALYGETDPHRTEWVEAQTLDLLSSRTDLVIQRLEEKAATLTPTSQVAKTLLQVANYFRRNQPYMDYAEYLRRGWPIGTGVIEGTCRHLVKDRCELSGMLWTVDGAEALLALRAVNENDDWDDFHSFRRTQRHKKLYGTPMPTGWLDLAEHFDINQF